MYNNIRTKLIEFIPNSSAASSDGSLYIAAKLILPKDIKFTDKYGEKTVAQQFREQLSIVDWWSSPRGVLATEVQTSVEEIPFSRQYVNIVVKFAERLTPELMKEVTFTSDFCIRAD